MDKALKIGRLVAYAAETVMATIVVVDSIRKNTTGKKAVTDDISAAGQTAASSTTA